MKKYQRYEAKTSDFDTIPSYGGITFVEAEEDQIIISEEMKAWNERVDLDKSIKKNKAKRVNKFSKSRSL